MAEEKDFRKMRTVWLQSIGGVFLITAAAMLGVWLLGKPVLAFVYTDQILPFVPYLYSVLIAMMLYTITMCNNCVLTAVRKNRELSVFSGVALAVCILSSILLVKNWGINGAIASLAIPFFVQITIQGAYIIGLLRKRECFELKL